MSDWNDIEALWRSNEPPELGDIARRLTRQTRLVRAWVAGELAIGGLGAAFGVYLAVTGEALVGIGVVAFALFTLAQMRWVWRGALKVETGAPADTIAAALARNAAFTRYLDASHAVSVAAVALIALMVASGAFGPAEDGARMHRALISVTIGLGVVVLWLAWAAFYARRLARRRERLLALRRDLGLEG